MMNRRGFLGALAAVIAAPRLLLARVTPPIPAPLAYEEMPLGLGEFTTASPVRPVHCEVSCEVCGWGIAKMHPVQDAPYPGTACFSEVGYEAVPVRPSFREAALCDRCAMLYTGEPTSALSNLEHKLNRWTGPRGYRVLLSLSETQPAIRCAVQAIDAPALVRVFTVAIAVHSADQRRYAVRQIKYQTVKAMETLDAQRGPAFIREYSAW